MLNELENQSLKVVAKNTLEYLLEHGTQEGVIALVTQLLQLQVRVMQSKKDEEERKKHAAEQARWANVSTPAPMTPGMGRASTEQLLQQRIRDAANWHSSVLTPDEESEKGV